MTCEHIPEWLQPGLPFIDVVCQGEYLVEAVDPEKRTVAVFGGLSGSGSHGHEVWLLQETLQGFNEQRYLFKEQAFTTDDGKLHPNYSSAYEHCGQIGLDPGRICEWVQQADGVHGYKYASPHLDEWNDWEGECEGEALPF
jgi:hypothetical protein